MHTLMWNSAALWKPLGTSQNMSTKVMTWLFFLFGDEGWRDEIKTYQTLLYILSNDAIGGTGKTFLINLLLFVRKKNIALAVASSGRGATLLDGGITAKYMFCLPLDLTWQEKRDFSRGEYQDRIYITSVNLIHKISISFIRHQKIIFWF